MKNTIDIEQIIENTAHAALVECDADCMTAVRRDAGGVKHLLVVIFDRLPIGQGITWGMVKKICEKVLGV